MKVLLVDDDKIFSENCTRSLVAQNCDVTYVSNAEQAKQRVIEQEFDLAIIDLMLPPSFTYEGLNFLKFIKSERPDIEPLMITMRDSGMTEIAAEAMKAGAN